MYSNNQQLMFFTKHLVRNQLVGSSSLSESAKKGVLRQAFKWRK